MIQKVKETPFAESKEENLKIIKEFQREWTALATHLSKTKNAYGKSFVQQLINDSEELNIKEEDIQKINYQERIKTYWKTAILLKPYKRKTIFTK